ncbi:NAD(P)-dependent alcohol dehydrogenase [Nonomuraea sp. NPDC050643]|uniref:NAD(P)-dependent alcohol dehydrogenase n=1 Tax=Nonomuraea sp. NPDC050643 TaxID=3155660 RepID=UPI0033F3B0B4
MADATMKAIRFRAYGPPDVLQLEDVAMPAVGDDEILIRVRAASVNPLDWHGMRGTPYVARLQSGLSRPKDHTMGGDLAGHVEAVGRNVTKFKPGDDVFGGRGIASIERSAGFAEYASMHQDSMVARKPGRLTFEEAASVPVAAVSSLQALRDKGRITTGHRLLINGAAGGMGTFAVQLAKAYGAEVTGVCSTPNLEMVRSIGADHVIDYTKEDFTRTGRRYDLILDLVANRSLTDLRRILTRTGALVNCAPAPGLWAGPLIGVAKQVVYSRVVRKRMPFFLSTGSQDDLLVLHGLIEDGKITPVIDRTYALGEVREAVGYLERGHAKGKVVISV